MISRLLILLFLLPFLVLKGTAQQGPFHEEIDFVRHLIQENEYKDASYVLHRIEEKDSTYTPLQKDSVEFLLGWCYYNIQSLETALTYYQAVSDSFPEYQEAKFFQSFISGYLGKDKKARRTLDSLKIKENTELKKVKNFELAGLALLNRDYKRYKQLSSDFQYDLYSISEEQKKFDRYYEDLKGIGNKSPLLAGVMSAIVPGSGKVYIGNTWKGLSSFLAVSSFGAVAGETFFKRGPESAAFIASSSVFAVFYVGNIWGSVLSVNVTRQERYAEIDHQVKLNMHIPLRRTFD